MNNKMNDKILTAMQMIYHIISDSRNALDPDALDIMKLLVEEKDKYKETGDTRVLATYKAYFQQFGEIVVNAMEEINKNENL